MPHSLARRLRAARWLVATAFLIAPLPAPAAPPLPEAVQQQLAQRFQVARESVGGGEPLVYGRLEAFYRQREHRPLWVGPAGVRPEASRLVEALQGVAAHGLDPLDYHLTPIVARLADEAPAALAELDLLLTDAYLRYATEVRTGRAGARPVEAEWLAELERDEPLAEAEVALAEGRFPALLAGLPPQDARYRRLQEALAHLRAAAAAGGWRPLPPGGVVKFWDQDPQVPLLRARLRASGDLPDGAPDEGQLLGPELAAALRGFQARHGLKPDAALGPVTRAALDVPMAERIRQVALNLERWRWMPRPLEGRAVFVNMAGFEVEVFEQGRPVLAMRSIVGRDYRQTPVFRKDMTYLVFNPFWNVPPSLAVQDLLPQVRRNPGYLAKEGIRVFSDWSARAEEVDPATIRWERLGKNRFPYKLRQDPGPRNSLGRIKFMLPNRFNVYLHDTPHRHLFEKTVRTFSSGCVRLEQPFDLAEYLLRGHPGWDRAAIEAAVESGETKVVWLRRPIPVYFLYWTAWVDDAGVLQFRDDVYDRDRDLVRALARGRFPSSEGD
ncbi:MAG: L,D-transpeptidase family protein [Deferrisomatales bacterium]